MIEILREFFLKENLQGYLLHTEDGFRNYNSKAIKALTNFSGSNALLVVLQKNALFFTDGRYLEQATKELNEDIFTIFPISTLKNFNWSKFLKEKETIGYHPMLFTQKQLAIFSKVKTKPLIYNQIEPINLSTKEDIFVYPVKYAGQKASDKLRKLNLNLNIKSYENYDSCYLITDTSFVCYILNIRSKADNYKGMCDGYLIILKNETIFFTDMLISEEVQKYLSGLAVKIKPAVKIRQYLLELRETNVLLDFDTIPMHLLEVIQKFEHNTCYKIDQACKTTQEIENAKQVHITDAIAFCELLAWVQEKKTISIYEADLANKLIELRKKNNSYIKESFAAICGFKENSSIIHYKAPARTSKQIKDTGILLIDTGGHYHGGTTDATRVIYLGKPSEEEKLFYTLVLKGHIQLARVKFKNGTSGQNLDSLARFFLWGNFSDYPHSTGHGVGNFLDVHEGPCGISNVSNIPLAEGMILSNEPGFYKEGNFGIRIENLMFVKQSLNPDFLEFETLTLLPFCAKLIKWDQLSFDELFWIKEYYKQINTLVMPHLSSNARKYVQDELIYLDHFLSQSNFKNAFM